MLMPCIALALFAGTFVACQSGHGKTADSGKRKVLYYRDPMNPSYTSPKPGKAPDGMDLEPVYEEDTAAATQTQAAGEGKAVHIDPSTIQNMGVTTQAVAVRTLTKTIKAGGTIAVDESNISIVNVKIQGWIEKLHVDYTGQPVKKGQPLFELYSPDLISTEEELLQSLRYLKNLPAGSPQSVIDQAMDLVESAKRRLANWDIPASIIDAIDSQGVARRTLTIFSPANGVVLEKMISAGQNVTPGMPLYRIGDISQVWAIGNVYQQDLAFIKKGTHAEIEVPSLPGQTFSGTVSFISPVLDTIARTAQIRIDVRNTPDFALKPGLYASLQIESPVVIDATVVPEQALIFTGKRTIAILSIGNGSFKPVEVKTGAVADGYVQVLQGLSEGDTIVTSAQFLIDSESNLNAAIDEMSGHGNMHMEPQGAADAKASLKPVSNATVYVCPMHPQIVRNEAGKCPICGMDLVKKR
jgi:RND family efflux transporter MFP subunit